MKKKTPWRDPIVEEVRRAREEYAAKFDFDLRRIGEDLRRQQEESGDPVVSFSREGAEESREPSRPRRRSSRS